jgi:DNA-binding response OmpR family regulator
MRILIVEDDKKLAAYIEKGLKEAGFVVDRAESGDAGLQMGLQTLYDSAIVDIMLPQLDGLTLIERMRARKVLTPVLILSAKHSVDDRIRGLQRGGDDYLTKPFSFSELLARIQALIRRANRESEPTSLTVGDLSMDLLKRELSRAGVKIELQPREFALLEYLMRNHDRTVSKTMILEHVWGYGFDPLTNVVDVVISRLRTKLDHNFDQKLIHTFRGVGYALKIS